MIAIINSSKTLDFDQPSAKSKHSMPEFLDDADLLIKALRQLSRSDIASLMSVSAKLAELNYDRIAAWRTPFNPSNARPAIAAFKGDVYDGLDAAAFSASDLQFAQAHLRILSGLFGILRPLDLIQPYRLEMAYKLKTSRGKNLYDFWDNKISDALKKALKKDSSGELINLASLEYYKTVKQDRLDSRVITPVFKEMKGKKLRTIAIYAKRARGLMCNYIIKNRLTKAEDLKNFNLDGYCFDRERSSEDELVFVRG